MVDPYAAICRIQALSTKQPMSHPKKPKGSPIKAVKKPVNPKQAPFPIAALAAAISFPIVEAMRESLAPRDVLGVTAIPAGACANIKTPDCGGQATPKEVKQLEGPGIRSTIRELVEILHSEINDLEQAMQPHLSQSPDSVATANGAGSERPGPCTEAGAQLFSAAEVLGHGISRVRELRRRFQG